MCPIFGQVPVAGVGVGVGDGARVGVVVGVGRDVGRTVAVGVGPGFGDGLGVPSGAAPGVAPVVGPVEPVDPDADPGLGADGDPVPDSATFDGSLPGAAAFERVQSTAMATALVITATPTTMSHGGTERRSGFDANEIPRSAPCPG